MTYCTACGSKTEPFQERHQKCPSCNHIDWSNPVPAVGVVIMKGEEILLAQRGAEPKAGQWDLVGGFVEAGESGYEALVREVAEETTLNLTEAQIIDILPGDYAGRPSINMLYIGKAEGTPSAQDDVAALKWFHIDDLPSEIAWAHEAQILAQMQAMAQQVREMGNPAGA